MSDRCISDDYELRGQAFEVWTDGHANPGLYPNWWLVIRADADGLPALPRNTVLTGEEAGFDPPLSAKEIEHIGQYVADWLTD